MNGRMKKKFVKHQNADLTVKKARHAWLFFYDLIFIGFFGGGNPGDQ